MRNRKYYTILNNPLVDQGDELINITVSKTKQQLSTKKQQFSGEQEKLDTEKKNLEKENKELANKNKVLIKKNQQLQKEKIILLEKNKKLTLSLSKISSNIQNIKKIKNEISTIRNSIATSSEELSNKINNDFGRILKELGNNTNSGRLLREVENQINKEKFREAISMLEEYQAKFQHFSGQFSFQRGQEVCLSILAHCNYKGINMIREKDIKNALKICKEIILHKFPYFLSLHNFLGNKQHSQKSLASSRKTFEDTLKLGEILEDKTSQIKSQINIASNLNAMKQFGEAQKRYEQILKEFRPASSDDQNLLPIIYSNLVDCLKNQGERKEKYSVYLNKIEEMLTENMKTEGRLKIRTNLCMFDPNYENSIRVLEEIIKQAKILYSENHLIFGNTMLSIGEIHLSNNFPEKAEKMLEEALKIAEVNSDLELLYRSCQNLAFIFLQRQEYRKSMEILSKIPIGNFIEDPSACALFYLNFGSTKMYLEEYSEAIEIFKKGLEFSSKLSSPDLTVELQKWIKKAEE